jgi:hypothetical protein
MTVKKEFPDIPPEKANGKVFKGSDNKLYIAKRNNKGIPVWEVIKKKKTPEEYYKQFPTYVKSNHNYIGLLKHFTELARKLKPYKISVVVIPWNKYYPMTEIDDWFSDTKIKNNYILYSENKLFWDARRPEGCMHIYHDIDDKLLSIVNTEIKNIFPDRTNGITSRNDALKIYFSKKKNIPIDVDKIVYSIDFTFDKTINLPSAPIIDKINTYLHKIGYVDSYDMLIQNGSLNVYCNINFNKIAEFKRAIKSIKTANILPKIKKISYTVLDD